MITSAKIKEDLLEIRYYFTHKASFDKAVSLVGTNTITDKVNKYNRAVQSAPVRLYDLYVELYVNGNTQESTAVKMSFTPQYIQRLNKNLVQFLQGVLQD